MPFDYRNTYAEVDAALPSLALLPVGSTEQEGTHLPVGAATLIVDTVAERVAEALGESVYRLPALPFGESISHLGSAGVISLSWETLLEVITDIVESLLAQGIHKIVVIDSIGGPAEIMTRPRDNYIVKTTVRQLNYDHPELDALWVQPFTAAAAELREILSEPADDVHAGELTTSLLLHLAPDLVAPGAEDWMPALGKSALDWAPFRALCPGGTWGRPSLANAEKGRLALDAAVHSTVAYIQESFAYLTTAKGRR
jgi:creatinine amidohydrolase